MEDHHWHYIYYLPGVVVVIPTLFFTDEANEPIGTCMVFTREVIPEQIVIDRVPHAVSITAWLIIIPAGEAGN